ncbi:hypothetical protein SAMN02746065_109137 [Desulfocicer vacuolatum DSM 3385]|uniref:SxtJ n=1 Tax=Desulfocicer vacuolatum DSM 3385 TaxID=1121400 RepID=A0A1W2BUS0_9BACT|nr:SxtJ family membrane protein [Desulfocicer vacuolatum]SMC76466.1 hypothetical protein SAMN02746065_109137 [Desulfocicer vacuolatum DSM 3385]
MHEQSLTRRDYRHFAFLMALFVLILFGVLWPLLRGGVILMKAWPWVVAGLLVCWGMVWPEGLRFIHAPWMAVGRVLGILNTTVILTLVFYLFITPMAIVLKVLGKDTMERTFKRNGVHDSHWKKSSNGRRIEYMEKIY